MFLCSVYITEFVLTKEAILTFRFKIIMLYRIVTIPIGCHSILFLVSPYKVAAVEKAALSRNFRYIKLSTYQHAFCLCRPDMSNMPLTASPVSFMEMLGKIRIAHTAHSCKFSGFKLAVCVRIYIYCYIIECLFRRC